MMKRIKVVFAEKVHRMCYRWTYIWRVLHRTYTNVLQMDIYMESITQNIHQCEINVTCGWEIEKYQREH